MAEADAPEALEALHMGLRHHRQKAERECHYIYRQCVGSLFDLTAELKEEVRICEKCWEEWTDGVEVIAEIIVIVDYFVEISCGTGGKSSLPAVSGMLS